MSQETGGRARQDKANRLADAKSPYLQQHAQNPVDWYPWGPEALEKAKTEDKPIFLSIGYSTCHWCHVMAHESFEDDAVARLMNDAFVNIKLDREERPDLDAAYMQVCQMMTGSGGWPLTIIMTPEQEPFYAATYVPKDSRHGRPGMRQLVPAIQEAWQTRRQEIAQTTKRVKGRLGLTMVTVPGPTLGDDVFDQAAATLAQNFDADHGGFGSAPKFPSPHQLLFLLRHAHRTKSNDGTRMATKTLHAMRRGGIHDHVGGGFHRYSVDARWHVPHFEKMLYDQAMIVLALLEAVEATGDQALAETARNVITYVNRDLRDAGGAFYSSEDADSEGEEGRFYVWTQHQIQELLGDDAPLVLEAFGVRKDGNWVEEATGRSAATNILHRPVRLQELARRHDREHREARDTLTRALHRLQEVRAKRPRPHRDEKVLTDWNGLMIAALAKAARVLDEPEYAKTARKALSFVMQTLTTSAGDLLHRWVDGDAAIDGFLDDHAFLTWGLIELHQATQDHDLLEQAVLLQETTIRRFWDAKDGGFFFTSDAHETPLGRRKEVFDTAVPSGQSVALENLVRLSHLTGRTDFDEHADRLVRTYSLPIEQAPHAFTHFHWGAMLAAGPSFEIVIAGEADGADTQALHKAAWKPYTPNKVVLTRPASGTGPNVAPYAADMTAIDARAAAYVCQDHACQRPVTHPHELVERLTTGDLDQAPTG